MLELFLIAAVIYLWFRQRGLSKRLRLLEDATGALAATAPRTTEDGATDVAAAPEPDAAAPAASSPWGPAKSDMPPPPEATPAETPEDPDPYTPPRTFVLTPERMGQLSAWFKDNWAIAIAALSLALAGVFFVQYGIENGILSPPLRVLCAIGLGVALVAGGEYIRRRLGDDHDLAAYLPSALSGAGLVAMMSGILAARQLYGLIDPGTAFLGLLAVGVLSIALGWFYGPFLIAFGIIGTSAAPFLVGGESEDGWMLFYYFALIMAVGFLVDALKRSAWVTVVALAVPTGAAGLLWLGTGGTPHAMAFGALTALFSVTLPVLSLRPGHAAPSVIEATIRQGKSGWPEFPARIAFAGGMIALIAAGLGALQGATEFWLALAIMTLMVAAAVFWFRAAPGIEDLAIPAGLAIAATLAVTAILRLPAANEWITHVPEPEAALPRTMAQLTVLGLILSALAAWAAFTRTTHRAIWAMGSALAAPVTLIILDLWWHPDIHLSGTAWALHIIAVAALMTALAARARSRFGDDHLPMALFTIAALSMLGFAAIAVFSKTALTLAFALLTAAAAWLDKRHDLSLLTWFAKIGALTCSFRLVLDPGVLWAVDSATWPDLLLAYLGTLGLLACAWWLMKERARTIAMGVVESVIATLTAVFGTVVLFRLLEDRLGDGDWTFTLFGLVWLISAMAQLYRARLGGRLRSLRLVLAAVFGALGLLLVLVAMTVFNPVFGLEPARIAGWPLINSLLLSYLLPAALVLAAGRFFTELPRPLTQALMVLGGLFAAAWATLAIRHAWQGPDMSAYRGTSDGEMYSYTIALILVSAALLVLALLRRSALLRKAGLAVAALAVAKVFLLDASGLAGLVRVFSFLALGLALGGLAMINRWIIRLQGQDAQKPAGGVNE